MMDITVRNAAEADIETVCELEKQCFSDPWSESFFHRLLRTDSLFLVALCDGKVTGYAAFGQYGEEAELYNIAVAPDQRGKGIAGKLLCEGFSRLTGAIKVYLEVRESNAQAISLYEKFGFKKDGMRKNYYSCPTENAILMSLDLISNERP